MTVNAVAVDGSGRDGMYVWWEPGPMLVQDLRDACAAANVSGLLPKASTVPAALKETLSAFVQSAGIKTRGSPININPLREDVRGCEAVRQDRGDTENEHNHVISVVLDSGHVRIVKHDPAILPQVDLIRADLEDKMTEVFQDQMLSFPTSMVSNCISRVISHLGGVLCRKTGGVYFLPEDACPRFEPLVSHIERCSTKVDIVLTKFPLKPGERSYNLVFNSIRCEVRDSLIEIEDALQELAGSKQRSNGQTTRLNTLDALKAKLSRYESLLGVTMTDMHAAVEKVRSAVAAHNALEMCV